MPEVQLVRCDDRVQLMRGFSFKGDPRIADWQRTKLRVFCSALDGNVVHLANDLGLKVFEEDLLPYERGFLEKAPSLGSQSGWVVRINRRDRPETQKFTIAHEVGHFVLHGARLEGLDALDGRVNRSTEGSLDPFSYLEDRDRVMESEANSFAAALLMPKNLFEPAFNRLSGDVDAIARLFAVSDSAVGRRLRELGLR
ncbi:ImmA/IrrE family metallo-endopeptidase [Tabrizicola sp.]|uniref:ImmA/IrrE family metallo-endopeptidase n=1 Tax=Tabrizicola sp. TaxID=2005166 RepID=UPI002736C40B|nr:ImmA/IrrE family metallo-endopeptidase [Tabrizicola sp.]MDP3196761.1 ImmA/IrrE family metallo-endopeptidase [Tabrizicola sp.]